MPTQACVVRYVCSAADTRADRRRTKTADFDAAAKAVEAGGGGIVKGPQWRYSSGRSPLDEKLGGALRVPSRGPRPYGRRTTQIRRLQ